MTTSIFKTQRNGKSSPDNTFSVMARIVYNTADVSSSESNVIANEGKKREKKERDVKIAD